MQFVITVFFCACASLKKLFLPLLGPKVTPPRFWVEGLGRRMKRDNKRVQVQESLFPSNAIFPHTPDSSGPGARVRQVGLLPVFLGWLVLFESGGNSMSILENCTPAAGPEWDPGLVLRTAARLTERCVISVFPLTVNLVGRIISAGVL